MVVGNECPDISGRFENVGRSADDDSTTPRLTEYAFESDIMDVEYILISHPDAKSTVIEAEVTDESGQIRELRKDVDFTCSDGKLCAIQVAIGNVAVVVGCFMLPDRNGVLVSPRQTMGHWLEIFTTAEVLLLCF